MKIYNKTPKWREREIYKSMNAAPVAILRNRHHNPKYLQPTTEGSKPPCQNSEEVIDQAD